MKKQLCKKMGLLLLMVGISTGTGVAMQVTKGYLEGSSAIFSPDGNSAATSLDDGTINLWKKMPSEKFELVKTISPSPITVDIFAFNDSGTMVASVSGSMVALFDAATGALISNLQDPNDAAGKAHSGKISSIKFIDDSTKITTYSEADDTTKIWDVVTGELISTIDGSI